MADADVCQRIICDLESILKKHALLESCDVITTEQSRSNRSPVYVVENHLGIESWCIVPVYLYANQQLHDCSDTQKIIQLTNFLLLANPELQLAWNIRKKFYLQRKCSLQQELQISHLVLCRKPKTAEAFAHRKWVLSQEMDNYPLERRQAVLHSELQLCDSTAASYFSNYHAWDYRRHLLQEYVEGAPLIVESELQRTKEFLQTHVSDHSGMAYRQYVLVRVNSRPLYEAELSFTSELIQSFPGHEALWMHRRFCVLACLGALKWADKHQRIVLKESKDANKVQRIVVSESELVDVVLPVSEPWQKTLCERHIQWMKKNLQIDLVIPSMNNGCNADRDHP